jgi:hypothetical protein
MPWPCYTVGYKFQSPRWIEHFKSSVVHIQKQHYINTSAGSSGWPNMKADNPNMSNEKSAT